MESLLGKRKDREEEPKVHGFVLARALYIVY